jgi:hypothetical protein
MRIDAFLSRQPKLCTFRRLQEVLQNRSRKFADVLGF